MTKEGTALVSGGKTLLSGSVGKGHRLLPSLRTIMLPPGPGLPLSVLWNSSTRMKFFIDRR